MVRPDWAGACLCLKPSADEVIWFSPEPFQLLTSEVPGAHKTNGDGAVVRESPTTDEMVPNTSAAVASGVAVLLAPALALTALITSQCLLWPTKQLAVRAVLLLFHDGTVAGKAVVEPQC